MLRVYGDLQSGNCYKVKLLLAQLGRPHEWVHMDILEKQTRTPAFLSKNPNGQIPLLEIEEGVYLPESDAILNYLAEGTPFLPSERLLRAQVLQWLFFEQYSHEPYIAVARYIIRYLGRPEKFEPKLQEKMGSGYAALEVMEKHLAVRRFFAAERYTIADIGLYAYTHVAHEGGFALSRREGMARARQESARPHHHERRAAVTSQVTRRDKAVRVRYRSTRSLPKAQVLNLYRSVQWSAARKPVQLVRALKRSHSVVTAWFEGSLVGLGNAVSDGSLV